MRKLYKVRILKGEYLEKLRQDSGYIQQIASSPRVAANRAWAGRVQHSQLRDDEEVTMTVRLAKAN